MLSRTAVQILFCHALQPSAGAGTATLLRDLGIRHGRPAAANPVYATLSQQNMAHKKRASCVSKKMRCSNAEIVGAGLLKMVKNAAGKRRCRMHGGAPDPAHHSEIKTRSRPPFGFYFWPISAL